MRLLLLSGLMAAARGGSYELVKSGVECDTPNDTNLGDQESLQACADACAANSGCRFFIYGTDNKAKRCWRENTMSRECPEGWEHDHYDFYALTSAASPNPPTPPPPPPSALPSRPPPSPPNPPPPPEMLYHRERYQAECASADTSLGTQPTLEDCANRCLATNGCAYFIYGRGYKKGRCFWEHTNSSQCTEGWETDEYDFYSIRCTANGGCTPGCTEKLASNFDPAANSDDGSCIEKTGCVAEPCTSCAKEQRTGKCSDGQPYRSFKYDTVHASRVDGNALTIDGDLSDWAGHAMDRCYQDVPFARQDGTEVKFEVKFEVLAGGTGKASARGGRYFGDEDFSIRWMLAWDDTYLYLAAKVTDDVLQTSSVCYENGLQVAFEVGGPGQGRQAGMLQAERSSDLDVSRLELINMALGAEQQSCNNLGTDARQCCLQYELSQQDGGFFRRTKLAVLRNPTARTTTYEAAFHKTDLLGGDEARLRRWGQGLHFGFAFAINDGDDVAKQNGWAGYYPHAIVRGWNGGQKEPQKAGTVRLAGGDPPMGACGAGGGGGGGFWLGVFLTFLVLVLGGLFASWREGGLDSVKGYPALLLSRLYATVMPEPRARTATHVRGGLASSDYACSGGNSSYSAPIPIQPSFVTQHGAA